MQSTTYIIFTNNEIARICLPEFEEEVISDLKRCHNIPDADEFCDHFDRLIVTGDSVEIRPRSYFRFI